MIVITDTREQKPLTFDHIKPVREIDDVGDFDTEHVGVHVLRRKLDVGDYGCIIGDRELPVYIERKSKADLWGTMTSGYKRFKSEMERSGDTELIVAVECGYGDLAKGFGYKRSGRVIPSQYTAEAMRKKLNTLRVRYGLETWYCGGRDELAMRVLDFFEALARELD